MAAQGIGYNFPLTLGALGAAPDAAMPAGFVDPYTAQKAALRARMEQQPQGLSEEEIAKRRADNARQYQLGMLGVLSGDEGLGAVGGQVFKQALAARQPVMSEKGTLDPITGQFTYNPAYQRERDEAQLDKLEQATGTAYNTYQENRTKAQERAEQAAEARADRAATRQAVAAATAGNRSATQDARIWQLENSMADDFRKETSKAQATIAAHRGMQAVASRTDAASDVSLVYQFMKALDPGSTVREGEAAMAQNAAGIPDRVRNAYNNALRGTRLNPTQRAEFLGVAQRLAAQAEGEINEAAKRYRDTAKRRPGMDADSVVGGWGMAPAASAPAAPGKPAAGAPAAPGGWGIRPK